MWARLALPREERLIHEETDRCWGCAAVPGRSVDGYQSETDHCLTDVSIVGSILLKPPKAKRPHRPSLPSTSHQPSTRTRRRVLSPPPSPNNVICAHTHTHTDQIGCEATSSRATTNQHRAPGSADRGGRRPPESGQRSQPVSAAPGRFIR